MTPDNDTLFKHIIDLATGLQKLNEYGPRVASVQAITAQILAPSPFEARAAEDLAGLRAVLSKRGKLLSITAEWDDRWLTTVQFRFEHGYYLADGFDIRPGTVGHMALLDAIKDCRIKVEDCTTEEPLPAGQVPSRQIIYPSVPKAVEPVPAPSEAVQNPLTENPPER